MPNKLIAIIKRCLRCGKGELESGKQALLESGKQACEGGKRAASVASLASHDVAQEVNGMFIAIGKVIGYAADACMHLSSAEFFGTDFFACRGL